MPHIVGIVTTGTFMMLKKLEQIPRNISRSVPVFSAKLHTFDLFIRRDFQSETCLRLRKFWLSYVCERKRLLKINAFNIG